MEDYIPILIVAVVMLAKLFSPKKKQSQHSPENFPELPELSDLFPDFATRPEEKDERQGKKVIPALEPLGTIPLVEGGHTTDSEQRLAQMRTEAISDKVPKEKPKGIEILEDFEIRKAIIYHEILQPKYLE
ncbi:MAG: hypothetical protein LBD52_01460 [Prevotellaceae bacterium]|jgi:hypothetical protein|nr:hypothetical protein [Prevotellaceae bacterium]